MSRQLDVRAKKPGLRRLEEVHLAGPAVHPAVVHLESDLEHSDGTGGDEEAIVVKVVGTRERPGLPSEFRSPGAEGESPLDAQFNDLDALSRLL
jgi:hypothetical protein